MKSTKADAIVIKRRNVGESDRLLTVFTKQQGKIVIKASGVRKITSRRASHIEPLNYVQLSLYQGRKYPILTEAQTLDAFSFIKQDLKRLSFAYHICELIDGLCPENQENSAVFDLLLDTIQRLASEQDDVVPLIHGFEVELLSLLGYWHGAAIAETVDTGMLIENIMERKLKSRYIFKDLTN